jgi:hypothetical protein
MKNSPAWRTCRAAAASAAAIACLVFVTGAGPAGAQESKRSLKQTYQRAKTAFHRGDYEAAKKGFAIILRHNPSHTYSRNYMAQILLHEKERSGNASLERKMNAIVLDEVRMDGLTVDEAIEYLVLKAGELTGGTFRPNIILKGLGPEAKAKKLTLNLSKVPLSYTLKTIGDLAGVKFVYERYAIVGAPRPQAGDEGAGS